MNSTDAGFFNNFGLCCFYAKRYDLTLTCFEQALTLPTQYSADIWFNVSHIANGVGDKDLARQCLRRALSIDSNYAAAYNNFGVLEAPVRPHLAKAYFEVAAHIAPELFEPFKYNLILSTMDDLAASYVLVHRALLEYPSDVCPQDVLKTLQIRFANI